MIDILVLNYNDAMTTTTFVKSVKDFPSIRKVLVVDNHSTDDSLVQLKLLQNDKIIVVQTKKNGGYGAGNNFGIRYLHNHFESEYILLCNPDVIITNETCEKMESFLRNNQNFALVAPFMLNAKREKQNNTAFRIPTKWEYILSLDIIWKKFYCKFDCGYDSLKKNDKSVSVGALAGSLFALNVEKMLKYGMFDENMFLYCEEVVLGKKMQQSKCGIALLKNEEYIHNHSVSISKTYKSSFIRQKLLIKSKLYVLEKYFNANAVDLFIARFLASLSLIEIFVLSLKKRI